MTDLTFASHDQVVALASPHSMNSRGNQFRVGNSCRSADGKELYYLHSEQGSKANNVCFAAEARLSVYFARYPCQVIHC